MLYLLPQAVDRAAERLPDHEAIRFAGERLTYAELSTLSDRIARALVEQGVRRGDRVGILMKKSLFAPAALYGIMKAGGAYVPLDATAPAARLGFIVRDCGIRHLIVQDSASGAPELISGRDGVTFEEMVARDGSPGRDLTRTRWSEITSGPADHSEPGTIELDLAYILYTSGSTGVPKGVMHTHRSALSFAEVAAKTYGFHDADRLSNHAPLHFDLSTLDFFSSAVAGATTVIVPEVYTKVPASLSKLIADEHISVLYMVPLALTQLLLHGALEQRSLEAVRWVLFGGEPFPIKHLRRLMDLLPQARFCNVYGPTETNGCTYFMVPPVADSEDQPIPIGTPYDNVEALIVDGEDRPVAAEEPGELLIRSPTMMRGYWGRPDLNERAFFRRRTFDHFDDVFHRTGDLVRRGVDGNLHFLGRRDRQVKIRGYRVELDEVEATLLGHADVEAAAAFAVWEPDGSRRIEAAVIPKPRTSLQVSDLLMHVSAHLPPYAVPEQISIAREFPETATGKVDRRQLASLAANGRAAR